MPLTISDEFLREVGLGEQEARIEISCRLFAAGKLEFPQATKLAGITRKELEEELLKRDLPIVRLTEDHLQTDIATLATWKDE